MGEAAILRVTHGVFFLGVSKNPFYGFLAPRIQLLVFRRVTGVVRQFLIILPDMPLHRLDTVFGMGTQVPGRAVGTDFGVAFVFPVALPVGGGVAQGLVFRADNAVIIFIVNVLSPFMSALHRHGALVGCGQYAAVLKNLFADRGCLVSRIGDDCFHLRKRLSHLVIHIIKRHAVVNVSGCDHGFQNEAILVAGGVGLVGKLALMLSLDK